MHLALVDQSLEKSTEIVEKIEQVRYIGSRDIGKELNIDHETVLNHLEKAGYKKKLDVWMPHDLTLKNLNRISLATF